MIDQNKVGIMTKLAIYEKKEEREALALSKYYKSDYIRFNVLKTWVASTVVYWTIVGLYAFMYFDDILAKINDIDYFAAMYKLLFSYILVCGGYFVFATLLYGYRYEKAKPGLIKYNSNLKDLIELEGGPMHHAKAVSNSAVDNAELEEKKAAREKTTQVEQQAKQNTAPRPKVNKTELFRQREVEIEKDREQQIIENVRKRNERIAAENEARLREQKRFEDDRRMIVEKRKQLEQAQMEKLRAESMARMNRQNHIYNSDTKRGEY